MHLDTVMYLLTSNISKFLLEVTWLIRYSRSSLPGDLDDTSLKQLHRNFKNTIHAERNKIYSVSTHYLNSGVVWHEVISPNGCFNQLVSDGCRGWQSQATFFIPRPRLRT